MASLKIELTAAMIDNYATPNEQTKVVTDLIGSTDRITVEDIPGTPRSVHKFVILDTSDVDCPPLRVEESSLIFATACSLTTPRILFSPLQPQKYLSEVIFGPEPSNIEVIEHPNGRTVSITDQMKPRVTTTTLLTTRVTLDENRIFEIVRRLLNIHPYDSVNRSIPERNIIDALKRYWEAILSGEPFGCYKSLFNCLEKAVNFDEEKRGKVFDKAASAITGLTQSEIEELHNFNNRLKHRIRNKDDSDTLQRGESKLPQLAKLLKIGADNAILSKI